MGIESVGKKGGGVEGIKEALDSVAKAYQGSPFSHRKTMLALGVLAGLFSTNANAEAGENAREILGTANFIGQIEAMSKDSSVNIKNAVAEFNEFRDDKMNEMTDFRSYVFSQNLYPGDPTDPTKHLENSGSNFGELPELGAGVFSSSCMLEEASSGTDTNADRYSGFGCYYSMDYETTNQIISGGESYSVTVSVEDGADVNELIINAMAEKLGEEEGTQISSKHVLSSKQTGDQNTSLYSDGIRSNISVPLASWSITKNEQDGKIENITITMQPGEFVQAQ